MTSRSIHQRMDCLPGENANVHPEEELARKYFQEFRPDPKYKTKVIQLMKACELIFHLEGTDEYLVPDLLDDGNVPGGATTRSTNRDSLRLACDFLPEAKFLSFIGQCYLAGWIEDPAAECLRHGVLLTYDRARVLVRAIPGAKANEASIEVIPQGKPADNEFKDRIWGVLSSRMNLEKISANVRIAAAKNFDEMIKDEVNMAILKICRECPTITQKELRIKLKSLGLVSPVFNLGTLSRRIISLRECADREQISIPRLPGRKQ